MIVKNSLATNYICHKGILTVGYKGCIGSRCMAWRFDTKTDGHCGLAGAVGVVNFKNVKEE